MTAAPRRELFSLARADVDLLRRTKRKQFGPMPAQPVALMPPVRAFALDERPEAGRVVWNAQVAQLVHDHIVEHLQRR